MEGSPVRVLMMTQAKAQELCNPPIRMYSGNCRLGPNFRFLVLEYPETGRAGSGHAGEQRAGMFKGGDGIGDNRLEIESGRLEVVAGGAEEISELWGEAPPSSSGPP